MRLKKKIKLQAILSDVLHAVPEIKQYDKSTD